MLVGKEVIGIESGVSEIFKDIAVELVGAAFAHGHHLTAHGQSIFGLKSAGNDLKLPDAIQTEGVAGIAGHGTAAQAVLQNGPVQRKIIGARRSAIHAKGRS